MEILMRVIQGQLYLKTKDVLDLTGLTQGQLNGARNRGDMEPMQFVDGGDCYYLPENVLKIHRQILEERKLGSAKLRKSPEIEKTSYQKVIRRLERGGYVVDDVKEVLAQNDGTYKIDYKPYILPANMAADITEGVNPTPSEDSVEATIKMPPMPDKLPFPFWLGNVADIPDYPDASSDFENVVSGCLGYFDRTSSECRDNCQFQSICAALRLRILTAIGEEKDKGGDAEAIRDAVERERNLMAEKIRKQF